ncbi:hypothetical protein M758_8G015200 [Ceratodon purpureus]|nr:hypothetical protein M758_8G015200 [Ceratodon purpureus]
MSHNPRCSSCIIHSNQPLPLLHSKRLLRGNPQPHLLHRGVEAVEVGMQHHQRMALFVHEVPRASVCPTTRASHHHRT